MKNNNTWENFTLLKSEIKKIETLANRITSFDNCKVTAYSFSYDKEFNIVKCALEICRDYKEKVDIEIYLSSFLDDRRKSYAYAFVNNEYITIKNMKERLKNDR